MHRLIIIPLSVLILFLFASIVPNPELAFLDNQKPEFQECGMDDKMGELIERNLLVKLLSDDMREGSRSPYLRMVARNIYMKHHDIHIDLVSTARKYGMETPTLLHADLKKDYLRFVNEEGIDVGKEYLRKIVENRNKISKLIRQLQIESSGDAELIQSISLIDEKYLLHNKGLKELID